jgi:hypothetical protein
MPLVQTRGAASAQGFGEFAQATVANYIEDVFSTYLYTGNGSTQTITNGIDLSTKGGLVWAKDRTSANSHQLYDTVRGAQKRLMTDQTAAQGTETSGITAFNSNGWTMGAQYEINDSASTYASWTFRKQPKFFDVVTYTGTGSNTTIAHNLGAVPGCIIVKDYANAGNNWKVYHRSLGGTKFINLSATTAAGTDVDYWNNTDPTSSVFTVGIDSSVNGSGRSYVAYLFAHDAGGFGLTGTDNVISCGTFTATGNDDVTLGYEPQWVMAKRTDGTGNWIIFDNMRGMPVSANTYTLAPNTSGAETNTAVQGLTPTATGFNNQWFGGSTNIIYIAIRRGPMKVPTLGTSVFYPVTYTGSSGNQSITGVGFPPDLFMANWRASPKGNFEDRLRGTDPYLQSTSTGAEATGATNIVSYNMSGITLGVNNLNNKDGASFIGYFYQRAPGFFDEVCYTGNGVNGVNITHNLTVAPEFVIMKKRSSSTDGEWTAAIRKNNGDYEEWFAGAGSAYAAFTTAAAGYTRSAASAASVYTSTYVKVGDSYLGTNNSAATYVAYLFATCAGVSKVGSYTGTGTTQTINCGFTAGSRFVLIKRTDSTGDWYVWDSARGIIAGNDSYLLLNSTAAEVTSTDYIDTYSAGFEISSTAPAAINANGGSFIFFAVA